MLYTILMHPLAVFPQLLTFSLIAPLLLRLAVGIFILYLGLERYKKPYGWSATLYIASAILLVLGFYTQIAVITSLLVLKFDFYTDKKSNPVSREKYILQVVLNVILISLLFTGPGFLAFDLPL